MPRRRFRWARSDHNDLQTATPVRLPPVPWRDPHTVPPGRLVERQCSVNPASANLRTCLGVAYARNCEVYKSFDALEEGHPLDQDNFLAQLKYGELYYRLRALERAEAETLDAVELAQNGCELWLARKQLQETRKLKRQGTQKPAWTKPLLVPVMVLLLMLLVVAIAVGR
jgi:hypothetical protein